MLALTLAVVAWAAPWGQPGSLCFTLISSAGMLTGHSSVSSICVRCQWPCTRTALLPALSASPGPPPVTCSIRAVHLCSAGQERSAQLTTQLSLGCVCIFFFCLPSILSCSQKLVECPLLLSVYSISLPGFLLGQGDLCNANLTMSLSAENQLGPHSYSHLPTKSPQAMPTTALISSHPYPTACYRHMQPPSLYLVPLQEVISVYQTPCGASDQKSHHMRSGIQLTGWAEGSKDRV